MEVWLPNPSLGGITNDIADTPNGAHTNLLELPGGFINQNELVSDAARRELLEETGYICNDVELINWFYTWPGRTAQKNFVVVTNSLKKTQYAKSPDELGSIKVHKFSARTIRQEPMCWKIKSTVTISVLLHGYFNFL